MAKSKEKELGLKNDLDVLNEWSQHIKPFLTKHSSTLQQNINNMGKNLKRLIESNRDSPQNLKQIQLFAERLIDCLIQNQSLSNQSIKAGNNGSVFGKMVELVKYCCLYTIKKSQKEIQRIEGAVTIENYDQLSNGSDDFDNYNRAPQPS